MPIKYVRAVSQIRHYKFCMYACYFIFLPIFSENVQSLGGDETLSRFDVMPHLSCFSSFFVLVFIFVLSLQPLQGFMLFPLLYFLFSSFKISAYVNNGFSVKKWNLFCQKPFSLP